MANPEHLAKLKEGVEAWNKWRKENPKMKRDLTEANLAEVDLTEADLKKTDLGYASLTRAVLVRADLAETNLEAANFMGAENLEVEQLCESKTLYKVQLDQEIEKHVLDKCPHLLETARGEKGLGK